MIYLDNAATTAACDSAISALGKYAGEAFFNPSAGYAPALEVRSALDKAAEEFADLLGAEKSEIIFTSCATESNNYAFECGIKNKKGNVVVSAGEHASVYESAMRLKSRGVDVRFAPLSEKGNVTEEGLKTVVDKNTAFVSLIHVSNETGVINDISSLSRVVRSIAPGAVVHSDGVQAFCKTDVRVHELGVDLYSVSAHKVGGLKGVGALYARRGFNMKPFIVGGGQQNGRRSGTENVGGIIGFVLAAKEYKNRAETFDPHKLRNIFIEKFSDIPWIKINGTAENSGYILSVSFENLRGEIIAHMAEERGVLIGLGSACSTHVKANRVLESMGISGAFSGGSVRISFSPSNTADEASVAADVIFSAAKQLKEKING